MTVASVCLYPDRKCHGDTLAWAMAPTTRHERFADPRIAFAPPTHEHDIDNDHLSNHVCVRANFNSPLGPSRWTEPEKPSFGSAKLLSRYPCSSTCVDWLWQRTAAAMELIMSSANDYGEHY